MTRIDEAVIEFFNHIEDYSSVDKCWIWKTSKSSNDYGYFKGAGIATKAHRWVYMYLHGPISVRRNIHHKCDMKRCVNPTHLESLSISSHRALHAERGDFTVLSLSCKRGHEFSETNTYLFNGHRYCRECRREYKRGWRKRNA